MMFCCLATTVLLSTSAMASEPPATEPAMPPPNCRAWSLAAFVSFGAGLTTFIVMPHIQVMVDRAALRRSTVGVRPTLAQPGAQLVVTW